MPSYRVISGHSKLLCFSHVGVRCKFGPLMYCPCIGWLMLQSQIEMVYILFMGHATFQTQRYGKSFRSVNSEDPSLECLRMFMMGRNIDDMRLFYPYLQTCLSSVIQMELPFSDLQRLPSGLCGL